MTAYDDDARRRRGEAALHQEIARAQADRAAAARRIGALTDADEADYRARRARERARQAAEEADRLGG
jgi:hypothetical protein